MASTSRTVPNNPNSDACQGVELEDDKMNDDDGWDETLANLNFQYKPKVNPAEEAGHEYRYKNIDIRFPYKAYRSQEQLMDKIIEGVTTGQHCLLESPTGTGKTAALLCALLAWQQQMRPGDLRKIIDDAVKQLGDCQCGLITNERTTVTMKNTKGRYYCIATTITPAEDPPPTSPCTSSSKSEFKSENPSPAKQFQTSPPKCAPLSQPVTPTKRKTFGNPATPSNEMSMELEVSSMDSPTKRQKTSSESSPKTPQSLKTVVIEKSVDELCNRCARKYLFDASRPPKIYYCTRTHSQIAQVVKQLKNTAYKNSIMTILASREPTCINTKPREMILEQLELERKTKEKKRKSAFKGKEVEGESVSKEKEDESGPTEKQTLDDLCRLMKSNFFKLKKREAERNTSQGSNGDANEEEERLLTCEYFRPLQELKDNFSYFQETHGAFDLEDIKNEGRCIELCPYYGCHALQEDADIVFCSYNYLIDPDIRKLSNVRHVNNVVVFDEAHNIEDICRDAYSVKIDLLDFDKTVVFPVKNLLDLLHLNEASCSLDKRKMLELLYLKFNTWSNAFKDAGSIINIPFNSKTKECQDSYEDQKLFDFLHGMEMNYHSVKSCRSLLTNINKEDETVYEYYNSRGKSHPFVVASSVDKFLAKMNRVLEYIFKEEKDGIGGSQDYQGCLIKKSNPLYVPAKKDSTVSPDHSEFLYTFQIICLNPAVGFHTLQSTTFAVIVASGTLTPLNSFACELATNFRVTLQADHVIPPSHVWTGVVSVNSKNKVLEITKTYQENEEVQDEIGNIIAEVCETVPNGVLVFLPSYGFMHKLEARWRANPKGRSLLQRLSKTKMIFWENSNNKQVFKQNMEAYAKSAKGGPNYNGSVLFAVFRGKVSEGIDFADEQARAVVTVGIPFSNTLAHEIKSKRSYNDMRKSKQKPGEFIMSGQEWYVTQAFRAMNQGLGRCVRHSEDWGAIVLLDFRLGLGRNQPFISSWVKRRMEEIKDFKDLKRKLARFVVDLQSKKRKPIQICYEPEECTQVIQGELNDSEANWEEMSTQETAFINENLHRATTLPIPAPDDEIWPEMSSQETLFVNETLNDGEASPQSQSLLESDPDNNVQWHDMTTQETSFIVEASHEMRTQLAPEPEFASVPVSSSEHSFDDEEDFLPSTPDTQSTQIGQARNALSNFKMSSQPRRRSCSSVESDLEMSRIADGMQSPLDTGTGHNEQDESVTMDVSMPSADGYSDIENVSEGSSISYSSE